MLTDAQKVDVRRFCGYPAYGASPNGNIGWRFFEAYGTLEYRMLNLSDDEVLVVQSYLITLLSLETAAPAASANLDTDSAGGWRHNADEVRDRLSLLDNWRSRLCSFLGIPKGPGLNTGLAWIV